MARDHEANIQMSPAPSVLFAGIDNILLDNRNFDPSRKDIEGICRFFGMGKLLDHKKEKNVSVSHTNFFIFVKTAQGKYALKFYPSDSSRMIKTEFAFNRILEGHHFPTPLMHAGPRRQPLIASNGRLAACYSYINGSPAWQHINEQNTISRINAAILTLKKILSANKKLVPFPKQENVTATIDTLTKNSRYLAPYDDKNTIDASLLDSLRAYQLHQTLFTRILLHNNPNLANFLIHKNTVYTLDLAHVREDYLLSDLASLVISCFLLDIPKKTVRAICRDYFIQHQLSWEHRIVLNTLIKIGLVKEYLKNIRRQGSVGPAVSPNALERRYKSLLSERKMSIIGILKKLSDNPKLVV